MDRDSNGFVSSVEVMNYLRDQRNFSTSESECFRLVKFFDSDEDGRLSFQDFLQMLLPCEDNILRNITLDRPSRRVGRYDSLPRDIELAILDIIEQEIALQRRQDILKRDLEVRYDFSAYASYRSVDKYNDGHINSFNLGSFLRSCGHYATERELLTIVRRIDTDGDARLSYAEFSEFLRTSNPPSRQVLEESDRAQRAASSEKFRRSMGGAGNSSPLKASGSSPRAHSAGRGGASF